MTQILSACNQPTAACWPPPPRYRPARSPLAAHARPLLPGPAPPSPPQSADRRVLAAAAEVVKKGLARVTLLGRPAEVQATAEKFNIDISGCDVLDFLVGGDVGAHVGADVGADVGAGGPGRRLHGRRSLAGLSHDPSRRPSTPT